RRSIPKLVHHRDESRPRWSGGAGPANDERLRIARIALDVEEDWIHVEGRQGDVWYRATGTPSLPRGSRRPAATAPAGRRPVLPDDLVAIPGNGGRVGKNRSGATDRGHEGGRRHGIDAAPPRRPQPDEGAEVAGRDQHRLPHTGGLAEEFQRVTDEGH